MLIIDGLKISVSRGDTGIVTITFTGDVPSDGCTALVTLKQRAEMAAALWEKTLTVEGGEISFSLSTDNTDYSPGRYWWDVRIINGQNIFTPVLPQPFTILEVVGRAGN